MKLERARRSESEKSEKMQKREAHERAQIKRMVRRMIPSVDVLLSAIRTRHVQSTPVNFGNESVSLSCFLARIHVW